jgi:hypothetical protein
MTCIEQVIGRDIPSSLRQALQRYQSQCATPTSNLKTPS